MTVNLEQLVFDLVDGEKNYVETLSMFCRNIVEPLQTNTILKDEMLHNLFPQTLFKFLELHSCLLRDIQRLTSSWNEEMAIPLFQTIIRWIPGFRLYKLYLVKLDGSIKACEREMKRNSKFRRYVKEKTEQRRTPIQALYNAPMHRLTAYLALFKEFCIVTEGEQHELSRQIKRKVELLIDENGMKAPWKGWFGRSKKLPEIFTKTSSTNDTRHTSFSQKTDKRHMEASRTFSTNAVNNRRHLKPRKQSVPIPSRYGKKRFAGDQGEDKYEVPLKTHDNDNFEKYQSDNFNLYHPNAYSSRRNSTPRRSPNDLPQRRTSTPRNIVPKRIWPRISKNTRVSNLTTTTTTTTSSYSQNKMGATFQELMNNMKGDPTLGYPSQFVPLGTHLFPPHESRNYWPKYSESGKYWPKHSHSQSTSIYADGSPMRERRSKFPKAAARQHQQHHFARRTTSQRSDGSRLSRIMGSKAIASMHRLPPTPEADFKRSPRPQMKPPLKNADSPPRRKQFRRNVIPENRRVFGTFSSKQKREDNDRPPYFSSNETDWKFSSKKTSDSFDNEAVIAHRSPIKYTNVEPQRVVSLTAVKQAFEKTFNMLETRSITQLNRKNKVSESVVLENHFLLAVKNRTRNISLGQMMQKNDSSCSSNPNPRRRNVNFSTTNLSLPKFETTKALPPTKSPLRSTLLESITLAPDPSTTNHSFGSRGSSVKTQASIYPRKSLAELHENKTLPLNPLLHPLIVKPSLQSSSPVLPEPVRKSFPDLPSPSEIPPVPEHPVRRSISPLPLSTAHCLGGKNEIESRSSLPRRVCITQEELGSRPNPWKHLLENDNSVRAGNPSTWNPSSFAFREHSAQCERERTPTMEKSSLPQEVSVGAINFDDEEFKADYSAIRRKSRDSIASTSALLAGYSSERQAILPLNAVDLDESTTHTSELMESLDTISYSSNKRNRKYGRSSFNHVGYDSEGVLTLNDSCENDESTTHTSEMDSISEYSVRRPSFKYSNHGDDEKYEEDMERTSFTEENLSEFSRRLSQSKDEKKSRRASAFDDISLVELILA